MRAWLALVLAACTYNPPSNRSGDGGVPDGPLPPLEGGTMDCMAWTFAPAEAAPCFAPVPVDILDLDGSATIDSDTGMLSTTAGDQLLPYAKIGTVGVVSVSGLRVRTAATLRSVGSAPLAILAWGDVEIFGTVDVSSSIAGGAGAGSQSGCVAANNGVLGGENAGGGGGGFGGDGGDGGDGKNGNGGNGGIDRALPAKIEGGCEGADAGATGGGTLGRKGAGGGAIAIVAMTSLVVTGVVHAGGAGGTGGRQDDNGGGGGGSGGMIKLEAADLVIGAAATLAANGGGGGGGAQGGTAGAGDDGLPNASEANGGNNEGGGTDGGGGGFVGRPAGDTAANNNKGGGGGGGGVGYIVYKGHTTSTVEAATMSPAGQPF